jgi:hypothetical protein
MWSIQFIDKERSRKKIYIAHCHESISVITISQVVLAISPQALSGSTIFGNYWYWLTGNHRKIHLRTITFDVQTLHVILASWQSMMKPVWIMLTSPKDTYYCCFHIHDSKINQSVKSSAGNYCKLNMAETVRTRPRRIGRSRVEPKTCTTATIH